MLNSISAPLRVLQVVGKMNRGGAETMIMNYLRNLDRTTIQFDFIVHTDEQCIYDHEVLQLGGKIFHCPRYHIYNTFKYFFWWNNFFEAHPEYSIIHGHIYSTSPIYLYLAHRHGLKTIAHSHTAHPEINSIKSLLKNLSRFGVRKTADIFLGCSQSAGEWLFGEKNCTQNNFKILHNAINTRQFSYNLAARNQIREKLGIANKLVIGHVARFSETKNHNFLIDIFQKIHENMPETVLLLVGDGELRPKIEEKVRKISLSDSIKFLGVRTDVADLMQAMDIFLLPSFFEGLPVTLIEAQSSGLPCIVSDSITREVALTDLIKFISLNESSIYWAKQVLNQIKINRRDVTKEIAKAGYDITEESKKLTEFYISLQKDRLVE